MKVDWGLTEDSVGEPDKPKKLLVLELSAELPTEKQDVLRQVLFGLHILCLHPNLEANWLYYNFQCTYK